MSPTYQPFPRFLDDYAKLSPDAQAAFQRARRVMVEDLRASRRFRRGLRVKGVQAAPGVYEMTWAPDGRATFEYGPEQLPGQAHIVWRRIGTHNIFQDP